MNIEKILELYNLISNTNINFNEEKEIIEKLKLILSKVDLDNIEIIELIDTLLCFKKLNLLENINEKTIDLIIKINKNTIVNLEGTLYFSIILKHFLLPHNENKCDNEYNINIFLSEFEIIIRLIDEILDKESFKVLIKYNLYLGKLVLEYKKMKKLLKNKNYNVVIIKTMFSHMLALFYFNQEKYDSNYDLINQIIESIIYNYQEFINYCYTENIYQNYSKLFLEPEEIKKEYEVCQNMLDYTYSCMKENKSKRKC